MRIASIHVGFCLAFLATANLLVADDAAIRVTFDPAADFPTGVPTIVAGTLNRDVKSGSVFSIQHPSLDGPLVGQVDDTGRIFFALNATSVVAGQHVALEARPVDRVGHDPVRTKAAAIEIVGIILLGEGPNLANLPILFRHYIDLTHPIHSETQVGPADVGVAEGFSNLRDLALRDSPEERLD